MARLPGVEMMWIRTQNGSLLNLAQVVRVYIERRPKTWPRGESDGVTREHWNVLCTTSNGGTLIIAGKLGSEDIAKESLNKVATAIPEAQWTTTNFPGPIDVRAQEVQA